MAKILVPPAKIFGTQAPKFWYQPAKIFGTQVPKLGYQPAKILVPQVPKLVPRAKILVLGCPNFWWSGAKIVTGMTNGTYLVIRIQNWLQNVMVGAIIANVSKILPSAKNSLQKYIFENTKIYWLHQHLVSILLIIYCNLPLKVILVKLVIIIKYLAK